MALGKDLAVIPNNVIYAKKTKRLDLSNNNLQQLATELWNLPLRELDLSHNPHLGWILVEALKEAARCGSLEILSLRDIVATGSWCSGVRYFGGIWRVFIMLGAVIVSYDLEY